MPRLIYPEHEKHWLEMRAEDITSTDCAALFDMSPYITRFELWHRKKDKQIVVLEDNERMECGREIEPVIAKLVSRRYGVKVRKVSAYGRIDDARMGSSFDYEIVGLLEGWTGTDNTLRDLYTENGPGVLECKNVDWMVHRKNWVTGEEAEAPGHIEVQVQHQLEVIDRGWAVIAALVGGNTLRPIVRLRDREVGEAIRVKVAEFWESIATGTAPDPDFDRDADFIGDLYRYASKGKKADMRGNERLTHLCGARRVINEKKAEYEAAASALSAEILTIIGDHEKVEADGFTVSATTVAQAEVSYTRSAYRNLRITAKKDKAEKAEE